MSDGVVWSQDIDADLQTILEAIVAGSSLAGGCPVFIGAADKGSVPPFIVVWPIDPDPEDSAGLASEDWGYAHARWQVAGHGLTTGQARYLVEIITDGSQWPAGWTLDEIGVPVSDTADEPRTWFWPLDFRYQGA